MAINYTSTTTLESLQNPDWNYSHTITNLKIRDITDTSTGNVYTATVIQTFWQYSAVTADGLNTGTFAGATPLTLDTTSSNFVTFGQLDEATVIGWVEEQVRGGYAAHVHERINEQLEEKINATTEPYLPWAIPSGS